MRASLDYYTQHFGPYRYGYLSVVERPGEGTGMHADAGMITHEEGFAFWSPKDDAESLDLPFAVAAHEMTHQWTVPYASGAPPLATTLDLYRELQAVTPDSLQPLLHDLFEVNTFWELETERVTAEQTQAGTWQVTLDVRARKVVADEAGVETEVPMDERVEIGVFAPVEEGDELGEPLYVQMHRIRSGEQTITVTVPRRPVLAGIDPYHLLDVIELENDDNIEAVKVAN